MAEYVDLDVAIAKIRTEGVLSGGYYSDREIEDDVVDILESDPVANVAPVVHGEWEGFTTSAYIGMDEYGEPKFAERRFYVHKKCGRRSAIKEKYCPNCGAKMDGGGEHE